MPKPSAGRKHDDQERQPGREDRYEWIRIEKILLPKSDETLDEKTVAVIAESILVFDLLQPIGVRRVTEKRKDGEIMEKITLALVKRRSRAKQNRGKGKRKDVAAFDAVNENWNLTSDELTSGMPDVPKFLQRNRTKVTYDQVKNEWFRCYNLVLALDQEDRQRFTDECAVPVVPAFQSPLTARCLPVKGAVDEE